MSFVSNILLTWYDIKHRNQMAFFFMDLTNIEEIERLEYITVITEVASKLSDNLHVFSCTQLCKGKKRQDSAAQWLGCLP